MWFHSQSNHFFLFSLPLLDFLSNRSRVPFSVALYPEPVAHLSGYPGKPHRMESDRSKSSATANEENRKSKVLSVSKSGSSKSLADSISGERGVLPGSRMAEDWISDDESDGEVCKTGEKVDGSGSKEKETCKSREKTVEASILVSVLGLDPLIELDPILGPRVGQVKDPLAGSDSILGSEFGLKNGPVKIIQPSSDSRLVFKPSLPVDRD